jgi:thioredoxin reductase (NADPH)
MNSIKVTVYGANWCADCKRTKKYLGEQRIHYIWRNIEAESEEGKQAYDFVIQANQKVTGKPKRKIPVVVIEETGKEDIYVEPSNIDLAERLNLSEHGTKSFYHTIIIGGGPAGLTAALYLARDGYDVLVIEKSTVGGQAFVTNKLDNFPGFPEGISGETFASNLRSQVDRFGVEFCTPESVVDVSPCHPNGTFDKCTYKIVETNTGKKFTTTTVLIATGSAYRELSVDGATDLLGIAVHYCATCDGAFYKNKEIIVVGGGNSAFEETLWLVDTFVKKAIMIIRNEAKADLALQEKMEKYIAEGRLEIWEHSEIVELKGSNKLEKVIVNHSDKNQVIEYQTDGIFVFIGLNPNTHFIEDKIKTDSMGFIKTDTSFKTSEPGIYCAGDCRKGSEKQAVIASGEGASAALAIKQYLKNH